MFALNSVLATGNEQCWASLGHKNTSDVGWTYFSFTNPCYVQYVNVMTRVLTGADSWIVANASLVPQNQVTVYVTNDSKSTTTVWKEAGKFTMDTVVWMNTFYLPDPSKPIMGMAFKFTEASQNPGARLFEFWGMGA